MNKTSRRVAKTVSMPGGRPRALYLTAAYNWLKFPVLRHSSGACLLCIAGYFTYGWRWWREMKWHGCVGRLQHKIGTIRKVPREIVRIVISKSNLSRALNSRTPWDFGVANWMIESKTHEGKEFRGSGNLSFAYWEDVLWLWSLSK